MEARAFCVQLQCWEANPISNEGVLSVNIETCIYIVAFMIHFSLVS